LSAGLWALEVGVSWALEVGVSWALEVEVSWALEVGVSWALEVGGPWALRVGVWGLLELALLPQGRPAEERPALENCEGHACYESRLLKAFGLSL
jgi:hypothetical protein